MSEITYDDKVDLQVATNIANINKVTASDMNEIKNVVNNNAEEVGDITSLTTTDKTNVVNAVNELNTPEKWVSVGATAPTDGRRVWFKYSKNILDQSKLRQGAYHGRGTALNRLFIDANYYLSPGTYTFFSNFDTSRYRVGVQASTSTYPNELGGNVYDSGWKTIQKFEFTISNYGYLGVSISTSNGSDNLTPSDMSNYWFMICEGSYSEMIPYEPYIENHSINVDEEELFNKNTFDQNTSLITEYGNRMVLWGCEELGLKNTGYNANDCLPGQSFSWSVGQTITNVPSGVTGGRIYCFKGYATSGKFQICLDYPNNVSKIYFRNYFGSSWGNWKYITLTNV